MPVILLKPQSKRIRFAQLLTSRDPVSWLYEIKRLDRADEPSRRQMSEGTGPVPSSE